MNIASYVETSECERHTLTQQIAMCCIRRFGARDVACSFHHFSSSRHEPGLCRVSAALHKAMAYGPLGSLLWVVCWDACSTHSFQTQTCTPYKVGHHNAHMHSHSHSGILLYNITSKPEHLRTCSMVCAHGMPFVLAPLDGWVPLLDQWWNWNPKVPALYRRNTWRKQLRQDSSMGHKGHRSFPLQKLLWARTQLIVFTGRMSHNLRSISACRVSLQYWYCTARVPLVTCDYLLLACGNDNTHLHSSSKDYQCCSTTVNYPSNSSNYWGNFIVTNCGNQLHLRNRHCSSLCGMYVYMWCWKSQLTKGNCKSQPCCYVNFIVLC